MFLFHRYYSQLLVFHLAHFLLVYEMNFDCFRTNVLFRSCLIRICHLDFNIRQQVMLLVKARAVRFFPTLLRPPAIDCHQKTCQTWFIYKTCRWIESKARE